MAFSKQGVLFLDVNDSPYLQRYFLVSYSEYELVWDKNEALLLLTVHPQDYWS